jgi:hypothetical protein
MTEKNKNSKPYDLEDRTLEFAKKSQKIRQVTSKDDCESGRRETTD